MPTEEQIISQMENYTKFSYEQGKTIWEDLIAWASNIINLLKLFLPHNDFHVTTLEIRLSQFISGDSTSRTPGHLYSAFKGVIKAIHQDYKAGFLVDLKIKIRADADADFLAQAQRLIDEKLISPAAMLTGAVLEDVLRQLCKKNDVSEGKNIESMNVPLRKAEVYGKTTQLQITAWAGIRNDADHGHFDEYDINQVKSMHQGILEFIRKYISD